MRETGRAGAFALAALLLGAALVAGCGGPRPSAGVALAEPAPEVLWIREVAVLDVARGARTAGRDVVLEEGRIAAIRPAGSAPPPSHARVVDGAGATLVPGLVDLHGHVDADPAPTWEGRFPDHEANLRHYLYAGVTTVLDPGDGTSDAFERRERVARGELPGPRVLTAGPIHTAPEGHPIALVRAFAPWWIEWYLAPKVAVPVGTPAEARAAVDALAPRRPDVVKIVIDEIPLGAPTMSREVAAALVERAREHGLRTVAHIGTTQDAIDAAEAGVAAWVHGVYIERIPDADVARLAGYGIPMVATLEVFERYARVGQAPREATALEREIAPAALLGAFHPLPEGYEPAPELVPWLEKNRAASEARFDNVRRLHEAGVTILAGSDSQSGVFPGAGLHRELAQLVRAGLTPAEAIRAATLDAARFLEGTDDPTFGRVAEGQRADLLLVEGDPTADVADLSRIRAVFKGGVPVERTPVAAAGG